MLCVTDVNHHISDVSAGAIFTHIVSAVIVSVSLKLDQAQETVFDCFSIRFSNFHHSDDIRLKASSTSLNQTCPFSTIFLTCASVFQNILASSARSGTQALTNCLSSVQYNWFADLTCQ
jgi:hypothetical protein